MKFGHSNRVIHSMQACQGAISKHNSYGPRRIGVGIHLKIQPRRVELWRLRLISAGRVNPTVESDLFGSVCRRRIAENEVITQSGDIFSSGHSDQLRAMGVGDSFENSPETNDIFLLKI